MFRDWILNCVWSTAYTPPDLSCCLHHTAAPQIITHSKSAPEGQGTLHYRSKYSPQRHSRRNPLNDPAPFAGAASNGPNHWLFQKAQQNLHIVKVIANSWVLLLIPTFCVELRTESTQQQARILTSGCTPYVTWLYQNHCLFSEHRWWIYLFILLHLSKKPCSLKSCTSA